MVEIAEKREKGEKRRIHLLNIFRKTNLKLISL